MPKSKTKTSNDKSVIWNWMKLCGKGARSELEVKYLGMEQGNRNMSPVCRTNRETNMGAELATKLEANASGKLSRQL